MNIRPKYLRFVELYGTQIDLIISEIRNIRVMTSHFLILMIKVNDFVE